MPVHCQRVARGADHRKVETGLGRRWSDSLNQHSVHVAAGSGIGIMELAKMVYEAEKKEAGNGEDYVKA